MQNHETIQDKEEGLLKEPSRRRFLGASSAALAAVGLAGLAAGAQERSSIRKGESDHSSSDPGPENKALKDENPNSNTPPPTDFGDTVPIWYSFDLVKKRVEEGGWTHEVTERELPSSKDIAGVNMRLTAGSYRELHWHTADEWAYVLYGKARVTVMTPDGKMYIDDVGEGDLWIFPAGHPHSIQGLGPDGTEFLLVFPQGAFSEDGTFLLSEWMAHTPPEVLTKNFKVDKSALATLPTEALYIFPGQEPTQTLEQAKAEIGLENLTDQKFTFRMLAMPPTKKTDGGEVRVVDSRNLPTSRYVAAALVILKPGAIRELHWHIKSEWQYYIQGKGRMTVFTPVGNARTMDYNANDVGYVPAIAGHYVENTGETDLIFLETFASDLFIDISLNNWLRRLPRQMVKAHLGFSDADIERIPSDKLEVI